MKLNLSLLLLSAAILIVPQANATDDATGNLDGYAPEKMVEYSETVREELQAQLELKTYLIVEKLIKSSEEHQKLVEDGPCPSSGCLFEVCAGWETYPVPDGHNWYNYWWWSYTYTPVGCQFFGAHWHQDCLNDCGNQARFAYCYQVCLWYKCRCDGGSEADCADDLDDASSSSWLWHMDCVDACCHGHI